MQEYLIRFFFGEEGREVISWFRLGVSRVGAVFRPQRSHILGFFHLNLTSKSKSEHPSGLRFTPYMLQSTDLDHGLNPTFGWLMQQYVRYTFNFELEKHAYSVFGYRSTHIISPFLHRSRSNTTGTKTQTFPST